MKLSKASAPEISDVDFPSDVDHLPVIVVDSREQEPLPFTRLQSVTLGLNSGDYSILGLEHVFAVERKSIADLVGTLTSGRDRFERELHRLRGYPFRRWLIVGDRDDVIQGNYRSQALPRSILGGVSSLEVRYEIPVVWSPTPAAAASLVECWAVWASRESWKTKARTDSIFAERKPKDK